MRQSKKKNILFIILTSIACVAVASFVQSLYTKKTSITKILYDKLPVSHPPKKLIKSKNLDLDIEKQKLYKELNILNSPHTKDILHLMQRLINLKILETNEPYQFDPEHAYWISSLPTPQVKSLLFYLQTLPLHQFEETLNALKSLPDDEKEAIIHQKLISHQKGLAIHDLALDD